MCRNIRTLFNFEPAATDDEIRAASLQFADECRRIRARDRRGHRGRVALARLVGNQCSAEESRSRSGQSTGAREVSGLVTKRLRRPRHRPNAASHSACLKPTNAPPSYSTIGRLIIDGCSTINAIAFT
jgi:hypothetical protein